MEEGATARRWHNKNYPTVEHEMSLQRSNGHAHNREIVGSGVLCGSVQRLYLENRDACLRGREDVI
jgi:hypothetical protein